MTRNRCNQSNRTTNHTNLLFLTFFSFLLFTSLLVFPLHKGHCAQVTLAWDPDTISDLAGYKIYYGTASGSYQGQVDVGNVNTYALSNLTIGATYYAAATAYINSGLESSYSNEVMFTVAPCTYTISPASASFPASGGTGSVTITTPSYCNWTTSASPSWITVSKGSGLGSGTMTYTVSPNTGSTSQTAGLTIAGNVFTVTEVGQVTYTLSVSKSGSGGGTVSNNPTGTVFSAGSVVTLTAAPDANSTFAGWSGVCSGTSTTCQATMNSNLSVTATFNVSTSTTDIITTSASGGGAISPSGNVVVTQGASRTFNIIPNRRKRIINVQVDGVWKGPITSYTFSNINASHKISAVFSR